MNLSDSRVINASRSTVWDALLSADVLKECVPGCQEMTGSFEEGLEAIVVQKVGPVKATFKGSVVFSDIIAPERLKLTGQGKGGAAGFAKGSAKVMLEDVPEGTRLIYDVDAKVGGKLAQLGSRIIDGFAKKMADQFFERFQLAVEGPQEIDPDSTKSSDKNTKKGWFKRTFSS